jgi:hypothetical protein
LNTDMELVVIIMTSWNSEQKCLNLAKLLSAVVSTPTQTHIFNF